ncbi:hypothetical protein [Streptomyces sp. NPDC046985]|uniref:hypothetical protein n=1 Tax=Streptomyces sp. NPDC046985 TaxID=3155377 RepID=UPI0033D40C88
MKKSIAVAIATAALSLTAVPAAHAAPAGAASAAVTCPGSLNNSTHVQTSVDWLKVRTGPSTSNTAIGEIPGGAAFYFSSSSGTQSGGHYWVCGYGYNGSTKLTGWVAGEYLVWP